MQLGNFITATEFIGMTNIHLNLSRLNFILCNSKRFWYSIAFTGQVTNRV